MSKLKWTRTSPALIVSVIALIVALAGTAIAAHRINGGSIVKQSIGGGKLKKNTLTGFQINTSKIGTVPSAKRATNVFWVVANNPAGPNNVSLARSNTSAVTLQESGGAVTVNFPFDVSGCANVAARNNAATGTPGAGYAQTNGVSGSPNALQVHTRDNTGADVDADFHLIVICQ
jgi:hypothetical protein